MWLGIVSPTGSLGRRLSLLIALSFAFLSACSEKSSIENSDKLNAKVDLTLDFEDGLAFTYEVMPNFNFSHVYMDSIALLVAANKIQNSIDFHRLDNGLKIDSVVMALEGPNGLPRMGNFLFDSDTIYVTNPFAYELILFDLSGIALKRIRIKPNQANESLLPRYFTPSQIFKKGDFVYLSGDPDLNPRETDSYKKGKYMYEVDIKTGEFRSVFDVPEIYHKDQWMINQYFYRQIYDENRDAWLFSFEVDDSIRLYNLQDEAESFFAGSMLSGDIRKWNKTDINSQEAYRYYLSNKVYGKVVYDEKNALYYRFVKHPNRDAMMKKDVDQMWMRNFSIVVLDENLSWVGETKLDYEFIGDSHVSTKDGVYLSYFKEGETEEGEVKYVKLIPIQADGE